MVTLFKLKKHCNFDFKLFKATNGPCSILVKLTKKSLDSKKQLQDDELVKLIDLVTSANVYTKYALSLIITFLFRDESKSVRLIALELVRKGSFVGSIKSLRNVNLSFHDSLSSEALLEKVFVNLRGINLKEMDISGWSLDLSGHDLGGLQASKSNYEKLIFRHCNLEKSSFSASKLTDCSFSHSVLFQSDLSNIIQKVNF